MTLIYGLSSDNNPENIRYIGKTSNIADRLKRHLAKCNLKSDTYKNRWIKLELLNGNNIIIISLYEINSNENWEDVEIFWIAKYRKLGFNLTNGTVGGEGIISDDVIKKRTETRIKNNLENKKEEIEKYNILFNEDKCEGERICPCCSKIIKYTSIRGLNSIIYLIRKSINRDCINCNRKKRKHTQESKDKISKSKDNLSQQTRDKLSKIHIGKIVSNVVREKISNSLKGNKLSEETKKKLSKTIICMETGTIYSSIKEAAFELGLHESLICGVLKGKNKHTKGLTFKYINNE
jgi:hypothetical protein